MVRLQDEEHYISLLVPLSLFSAVPIAATVIRRSMRIALEASYALLKPDA